MENKKSVWTRAKFILPMTGMFLVSLLGFFGLLVIIKFPETSNSVSMIMPIMIMTIGGLAGAGAAGVVVHDSIKDKK